MTTKNEDGLVFNLIASEVKWIAIIGGSLIILSACGGGDDKDDPPNQAPTANAGVDATVAEMTTITLDGSGSSDPNAGDNLSYLWSQTAGSPSVTINNSTFQQANFSAPDVTFGAPQNFTFQLTVTDDDEAASSDSVVITVLEPGPQVTVSGTASYEFVPANNNCQGLAFPSAQPRPIRGATIQVFDANTSVMLDAAVTDATGGYSFVIDSQLDIFLRVRAELKQSGVVGTSPSWDVEVRDNTSDVGMALNLRPLYVLDDAVFNTGGIDQTHDILAQTGWDGSAYTSTRAAAPFSILDTIYNAIQLVLSADSTAQFPALDAFWSINNNSTDGAGTTDENIDSGEIGGSFYSGGRDALFLLGMDGDDTEEFDVNVIAHEWGHYFEDNFSRSDSIGGSHSLNQRLDMRLSFGEGWGTAIAGMITGQPQYCDTADPNPGPGVTSGFGFNIDSPSSAFNSIPGWYNEITVMALLYDLWDTTNESAADTSSIGFTPIYNVMTNQQANTEAFTSVFSFMAELKTNNPGDSAFIDGLLAASGIATTIDLYGSNETNDSDPANVVQDVLPVYTTLNPDGSIVNVCSNRQFDTNQDGNKLSERQMFRFSVPSAGNYQFTVTNSLPFETPPVGFDCEAVFNNDPDDPDAHRYSDPDVFVYQNGNIVAGGTECNPNMEPPFTFPLSTGPHVMSLLEFRYADEDTVAGYPARTCFNVSITPQ